MVTKRLPFFIKTAAPMLFRCLHPGCVFVFVCVCCGRVNVCLMCLVVHLFFLSCVFLSISCAQETSLCVLLLCTCPIIVIHWFEWSVLVSLVDPSLIVTSLLDTSSDIEVIGNWPMTYSIQTDASPIGHIKTYASFGHILSCLVLSYVLCLLVTYFVSTCHMFCVCLSHVLSCLVTCVACRVSGLVS